MAHANVAKLRKKAADFEQKKQFDRALSHYMQLLEEAGRDLDDADLQVFNRVGDLLQRQGNVSEALAYYEKAVDVYAERGFLNNAIALCNKILRQSPARTAVYYKLGKISASKGFKSDAKKNFLEYAERMQKSGHVDEAFRALKEFADLCPDQDDIRLMLAEWLQKENRKSEAIEQLEVLYTRLEAEGRSAEARATIDRIKAIDPAVVPRPSGAWLAQKNSDLVFLDLATEEDPVRRPTPGASQAAAEAAERPGAGHVATPDIPALQGLILTFLPDSDAEGAPAFDDAGAALEGFEATVAEVDAGRLDLLRIVGTPVGTPLVAEDDATHGAPVTPIDLLALPPVGSIEPLGEIPLDVAHDLVETARVEADADDEDAFAPALLAELAEPSWLAHEAIEAPALHASEETVPHADDAEPFLVADVAPGVAVEGASHDAGPERAEPSLVEHPVRDTSELIAQDATERTTDEILVVPSEVIDEETKRSLRLEFALDGDETPDAWVEAAMGARNDRSLDRSLDRLLTPLGVRVVEPLPITSEPNEGLTATHEPVHRFGGDEGSHEDALGSAHDSTVESAHESTVESAHEGAVEGAYEGAYEETHEGTDEGDAPGEAVRRSREGEYDTPPDVAAFADAQPTDGRPFDATSPDLTRSDATVLLEANGHAETESCEVPSIEAQARAELGYDDMVERPAEQEGEDAMGRDDAAAFDITDDRYSGSEVDLTALDAAGWGALEAGARPEIDLLDELTPPFMRHEPDGASRGTPAEAGAEAPEAAEPTGGPAAPVAPEWASALDVGALRAAVIGRDDVAGDATPPDVIDDEQIQAAFAEEVVDLPMLDVDDAGTIGSTAEQGPALEITTFSLDDEGIATPTFGEAWREEDESSAASEAFLDQADDRALVRDDGEAREEVASAASVDGSEARNDTDEWPSDAAPEVLIDGEWHDERMADLVSGEVRAITTRDGENVRRTTPRFDDLAAAMMWPSPDESAGDQAALTPPGAGASRPASRGTLSFGGIEDQLRRRLELDPGNPKLRQQLGEALLDRGDRDAGLAELDAAMRAFESIGDLEKARSVANVILRTSPSSVWHHQKRVEYAVRSGDRIRLVEAYVDLADTLFRGGEPDKARVVYNRVLELSPGNIPARLALGLLTDTDAPEGAPIPVVERSAGASGSPPDLGSLFERSEGAADEDSIGSRELPLISEPSGDEVPDRDGVAEARTAYRAPLAGSPLEVGVDARENVEQRESPEDPVDGLGGDEDPSVAPALATSLDVEIDAAFAASSPASVGPERQGLEGRASDDGAAGAPDTSSVEPSWPDEPGSAAALVPHHRGGSDDLAAPAAPADRVDGALSTDDQFVDLGSWLLEDAPVRTTRMVTAERAPTGDEQADFDEMLRRFKLGVAANVEEEDYASHYDLGVAYKEMGLVDEAISEFQKSLRGESHRVRSYEALGQCFVDKGQLQVAATLLRRAVESSGADDQQLVGVLYLLGYASEVMARHADALGYYQRVFAVDIEFRDVSRRVAAMEHLTQ